MTILISNILLTWATALGLVGSVLLCAAYWQGAGLLAVGAALAFVGRKMVDETETKQ